MTLHRPTPVNRLLTDFSWGTKDVERFRDGGLQDENVPTVHVLQAPDLLPRPQFLAAVLRAAQGQAGAALGRVVAEAEDAELTVLPNDPFLRTRAPA